MGKPGAKIIIVKKKIKGHGGHHGGSWKVAYADFVTAMMAFFMVMWILGMDQQLRQAIEGYFSNPVGYKKGYSGGATPISSGSSPASVKTNAIFLASRDFQRRPPESLEPPSPNSPDFPTVRPGQPNASDSKRARVQASD